MDPISLALMAFGAVKQGVALYKEVSGTAKDVTNIVSDLSKQVGSFFEHQEKAIEDLAEKKKNPPKGVSLQTIALENVLVKKRLEQAEVELRELLVYHAPPELGAVWEEFQIERKRLQEEKLAAENAQKKRKEKHAVRNVSSWTNGILELQLVLQSWWWPSSSRGLCMPSTRITKKSA